MCMGEGGEGGGGTSLSDSSCTTGRSVKEASSLAPATSKVSRNTGLASHCLLFNFPVYPNSSKTCPAIAHVLVRGPQRNLRYLQLSWTTNWQRFASL